MAKPHQLRTREYSAYEGCLKLAEFLNLVAQRDVVTRVVLQPTVGQVFEVSSPPTVQAAPDKLISFAKSLGVQEAQRLVGFSVEFGPTQGNNKTASIGLNADAHGHYFNLAGLDGLPHARVGPILDALSKSFDLLIKESVSEDHPWAKFADVAASLEYATTRLLRDASEQVRENASQLQRAAQEGEAELNRRRQELEREYQEKRDRAEALADQRQAKLLAEIESERRQVSEAAQAKEADIQAREAAFSQKVAEFETRDSRWVRRNLLAEIQKRIEANKIAKLSDETLKKRRIVHATCQAVMAVGLLFVGLMFYLASSSQETRWYHIAGSSAGTLLFGSTMVFYLRWTNDWFAQHARIEFRNIKFADDILRASWLAELAFEWETERKTEFPKELMQTFSRDLFLSATDGPAKHPTDDLARVVRTFRRLRLGRGIVDVESHPPAERVDGTPRG